MSKRVARLVNGRRVVVEVPPSAADIAASQQDAIDDAQRRANEAQAVTDGQNLRATMLQALSPLPNRTNLLDLIGDYNVLKDTVVRTLVRRVL